MALNFLNGAEATEILLKDLFTILVKVFGTQQELLILCNSIRKLGGI